MASLVYPKAPLSASIYIQIARRSTPAPTGSNAFLHILAPRVQKRDVVNYSSCGSLTLDKGSGTIYVGRNKLKAMSQRRPFATTLPRATTACVYNPQRDENDQEMLLEITDRAGKRLYQIMQKDSNPNLALRIKVESGGCHGFQYLMSLVTLPAAGSTTHDKELASTLSEDDTIFQYTADPSPRETTTASIVQGAPKVVIDQPSLELLKGSKVDFTMELIGSQFKIADNPHATSACGCGTSFDIKI